MSVTSTQTVASRVILADYAIHHSGERQAQDDIKEPAEETLTTDLHWNLPHRRVPAYRPIDRDRDQSQIRVYTHPIERAFITTMFTGVFINATAAKVWRGSFGRLNENIFKYRIGGEI